MARLLHDQGYKDVRPLLGGFDAWIALDYPVERHIALPLTQVTVAAPDASA